MSGGGDSLARVGRDIVACERCPRLVEWCRRVARERKRAHREETYWGRPVPGFGDPRARLLIVGLAPAAHGANRTGRMFTGDSSGDWLYAALHETRFASQAASTHRGDGLRLRGAWIGAVCRCAPPGNLPAPAERTSCAEYLRREIAILYPRLAAIVCLGGIAWQAALAELERRGAPIGRPRPRFGHGVELALGPGHPVVIASYHPSRQNTNTGRLRRDDFLAVFRRARARIAGRP